MDREEISRGRESGALDADFAKCLEDYLRGAEKARPDPTSMIRRIVDRVRAEQQGTVTNTAPESAAFLETIAGAKHRPGMVEIFRTAHQGGMRNTTDEAELRRVDTFHQIHSIIREETQPTLAKGIRGIWTPMQDHLQRGNIVVPDCGFEFIAPRMTDRIPGWNMQLAVLPICDFAKLFNAKTADQTLCLLRRTVERMGKYHTVVWLAEHQNDPDVQACNELLVPMRHMTMENAIGNGFSSGVSDVVNPLHNLVLDTVEQHGPDAISPELQERIIAHHLEFSVFQATFNLHSLAALERVLRENPNAETLGFMKRWSLIRSDLEDPSKGFSLDCNYRRTHFETRSVEETSGAETPVIDYRPEAFTPEELANIHSKTLRLGCPSLGPVHREFTEAMCRAYFAIVYPKVQAEAA